jgi:putative membrane protein
VAAPRAAATGAGQQQLTDANILAMLDEADRADSATGAMARAKAANPQVKDYGRMMTRDHHTSRVKGQKLAKSLKLTPQAPSDNPIATAVKQDAAKLQSTPKGEQFDRTYIEQQVAMHQQVIEFAKQAQQTTKNEQIRKHIEETSPVLQRHLQRAQEIQQSLGRMPT